MWSVVSFIVRKDPACSFAKEWVLSTQDEQGHETIQEDSRRKPVQRPHVGATKIYFGTCSFKKGTFSNRLRHAFFRRQLLSGRAPTCLKTLSMAELVWQVRGYHVEFKRVLIDADRYATLPLDPVYGRFRLDCRVNEDEVPLPFGTGMRQVNDTNHKATHV